MVLTGGSDALSKSSGTVPRLKGVCNAGSALSGIIICLLGNSGSTNGVLKRRWTVFVTESQKDVGGRDACIPGMSKFLRKGYKTDVVEQVNEMIFVFCPQHISTSFPIAHPMS